MELAFNEAREALAALPKWLKIAMWAQVISAGTIGFIGLGGVLAVQQDQIVMILNALNTLPKDGEAHAQLLRAIEIGANDGRVWMYQLVGGISASVAIGFLIGWATPMKSNNTPAHPVEQSN